MSEQQDGWVAVQESIALEIDVAINLALFPELAEFLRPQPRPDLSGLSEDWLERGRRFFKNRVAGFELLVGRLAILTDTVSETDYVRARTVWRGLEPKTALARARAIAAGKSAENVNDAWARNVVFEELFQAFLAMEERVRNAAGFPGEPKTLLGERQLREYSALARVLLGDDDFVGFWDWLDELVVEHYLPWRETRKEYIRAEQERALLSIRDAAPGDPTLVEWLPRPNPVASVEVLRERVLHRELALVLWAEPFGFFDFFVLTPGSVVTSFARAGEGLRDFQSHAEGIAEALKALGNPTRLLALRLVRFMEMSNRDMANYLEVSEPTISAHLKQLQRSGLVKSRRHGRNLHHTLEAEELRRLLTALEEFLAL